MCCTLGDGSTVDIKGSGRTFVIALHGRIVCFRVRENKGRDECKETEIRFYADEMCDRDAGVLLTFFVLVRVNIQRRTVKG